MGPIGEFEQLVLLAILQCGERANGAAVLEELRRHTARRVARGAVYMTLDRLEKKGLLKSSLVESTRREGRPKRCYRLTAPAVQALREARRTLLSLWTGLQPLLEK